MTTLAQQLEAASTNYQTIQKDLAKVVESRQQLDSQLQENEFVKKEFANLAHDANVYKLVGPVLVKQDKPEAASNVDKRIDYITAEIKRVEGQLKDLTDKSEKAKTQVGKEWRGGRRVVSVVVGALLGAVVFKGLERPHM